MKTELKNVSCFSAIVCALIEFPMIIFLSYFSLGSKEGIMEIYQSNPVRIVFIRGCVSFIIVSAIMSSVILLFVSMRRILLNVQIARKKIVILLAFNIVVIIVEILMILIYKFMTRGYI